MINTAETVEDLTEIDPVELSRRIGKGRSDRDEHARAVCYALQFGSGRAAYHLEKFEAAEAALEVLYAENERRIDERAARAVTDSAPLPAADEPEQVHHGRSGVCSANEQEPARRADLE